MEELKIGKYRHFKGMEYELIAVANHSETLEPMVVYKALYGEGNVVGNCGGGAVLFDAAVNGDSAAV